MQVHIKGEAVAGNSTASLLFPWGIHFSVDVGSFPTNSSFLFILQVLYYKANEGSLIVNGNDIQVTWILHWTLYFIHLTLSIGPCYWPCKQLFEKHDSVWTLCGTSNCWYWFFPLHTQNHPQVPIPNQRWILSWHSFNPSRLQEDI